jgi:hypothetical protein
MTLKESAVPLFERILYLEGSLDAQAFAFARKGLRITRSSTSAFMRAMRMRIYPFRTFSISFLSRRIQGRCSACT